MAPYLYNPLSVSGAGSLRTFPTSTTMAIANFNYESQSPPPDQHTLDPLEQHNLICRDRWVPLIKDDKETTKMWQFIIGKCDKRLDLF